MRAIAFAILFLGLSRETERLIKAEAGYEDAAKISGWLALTAFFTTVFLAIAGL
jgi:hypothetical protein